MNRFGNCFWLVCLFSAALFATGAATSVAPARAQDPPALPSPPPSPGASPQEVGEDDVVRVDTTLVSVPVSVLGRDRRFVPNLQKRDFKLDEEGVEQTITYFAPVETPFTVALVIDTSGSARFRLEQIREVALAFINQLRKDDRVLIVSFDRAVRVEAEATNNRLFLRAVINLLREGTGTRLYDAVDFVLNQRMNKIEGRKAVVLLTDGVDRGSESASYESTLASALHSGALVYPVKFYTREEMSRQPGARRSPRRIRQFERAEYETADRYLHTLATNSGAPLYSADDVFELSKAVGLIAEEIGRQYSLGYYPKNPAGPGQRVRISVSVSRPQLVVRARESYVYRAAPQTQAAAQPAASDSPQESPQPSPETAGSPEPASLSPFRFTVPAATTELIATSKWMCKNASLPSDYAVVAEGYSEYCPPSARANDSTNMWLIRKPGGAETICKGFMKWEGAEITAAPVPLGYVVTGHTESKRCAPSNNPLDRTNALEVKLPGEFETICKLSPVPRGYAMVTEAISAACPANEKFGEKNAWLIQRVPKLKQWP